MKKLQNLISLLLVAVMLTGMLPASATEIPDAPDENLTDTLIERPESDAPTLALAETVSGTCGENLTWTLTTDGTLTISGEGAMEDYDFGETPWEDYRGQILSVVVEDGVTSIGDYSFWGCWMLSGVTLPAQMEKIGVSAFHGCEELKSIDLPDGITELGCSVFAFCASLNRIEIPDGVTVIGESAFEGCENLERIVIPTSVQTIETRAFADCAALTELVIPEGVPAIERETACNCTSLKTVTLPASVMSIGSYAFEGCESLETVYFTGGRTQWDIMEIGGWNESLTEAEIICTGGDIMEGECGDALTWKLTGGALTISGTGEMTEYTAKAAPWYAYRALVVNVVIENGVTGIGSYAFQDCEALETVTLPESVEKIGSYAFDGCVSLEKAEIPEKVTVLSTGLFRNCTGLVCVTLPSGIETIGNEVFYQCKSLAGVEIPAGVPEIGAQAFYWCSSIESITIPEGVTTIGSKAFNHCDNLKTLHVPESLTTIGKYAFSVRALETIYYGGCPKEWAKIRTSFPSGVEVVCAKEDVPETVVSGNCGDALVWELYDNGTLIISGTGAMENYAGWRDAPWCNSVVDIVRVVIEDGVTTIGSYAFSYSPELEEVALPDGLISIGKEAFSDCTSLTAIELPDGLVKIGSHAFDFCSVLTSVTIPDSVTSLGEHAFDSCISMRELKISAGLTAIADYAFYNCSALVSVTVPEQVTQIGIAAFASCGKLETIKLPDGLTKIGNNAFSTCRKLRSIAIPAGVTEIGTYAFSGCEVLESFVIPGGVTVISSAMFQNCRSLRSVTLHDNVVEVGFLAFAGCSGLTELDLPDALLVIGGRAFSGCSALKKLDIPAGVVEIGEVAFFSCTGLTSLVIPDGISAIGKSTFEKCSGLVSITIPRSVVSIGSFAFAGCAALETVRYSGTEEEWGKIEVGEDNDALLSAEVVFNVVGVPELTVSNIASSGKIYLRWTKTLGAEKYEVYRATGKNGTYTKLTTTTGTSITNSKNTEPGVTYYYKVRAIAGDVQGEFSKAVGRTCDLAQPKVTATNIASTGKIKISWNKVDGAVKYEVYRATSKNGKYTRLTTTTKTSVTNTRTEAGVTYYYKVKAIASTSAANSAASTAVGRTCDLARPVVTVKLNSKGKPVVSWKAVSGAVKYEVYRATSENGKYTKLTTTTKTSITNSKAEAGVTYYYKVRAIASTSAANSAYSEVCCIKAK